MRRYHKDGTLPERCVVFVFGSNVAGVHGAGAARAAARHYGARYGYGIGLCGMSYALPTKDSNIETLALEVIQQHVSDFIAFARESQGYQFFITRIGCGLAGYTDSQIAPMFKECPTTNCSFPDKWKEYLE